MGTKLQPLPNLEVQSPNTNASNLFHVQIQNPKELLAFLSPPIFLKNF
jgi:hypothetical protein